MGARSVGHGELSAWKEGKIEIRTTLNNFKDHPAYNVENQFYKCNIKYKKTCQKGTKLIQVREKVGASEGG